MTTKIDIIRAYLGDRINDTVCEGSYWAPWHKRRLSCGQINAGMNYNDFIVLRWYVINYSDIHGDFDIMDDLNSLLLAEVGGNIDAGYWQRDLDPADPDSIKRFRETWDKVIEVIEAYGNKR